MHSVGASAAVVRADHIAEVSSPVPGTMIMAVLRPQSRSICSKLLASQYRLTITQVVSCHLLMTSFLDFLLKDMRASGL